MGAPYLMAVYTSAVASEFSLASGKEVLPIGGFTGSIPEPTIGQLEGMIRTGKFHLALLFGGHDPRLTWIASHCRHLGPGGGGRGSLLLYPRRRTGRRRMRVILETEREPVTQCPFRPFR